MNFLENLSAGFVAAVQGPGILIMAAGVAWGIIGGAIPASRFVRHGPGAPLHVCAGPRHRACYAGRSVGGGELWRLDPRHPDAHPRYAGLRAALLDGYELMRQGRAGKALGVSLICGTIGGLISIVVLIALVVPLGELVLHFGSPEVFTLALFGLTLIAGLSGPSFLKGLASGFFGLLLTTVGMDTLTGSLRFTFGRPELLTGIDIISAMVAFSLSPKCSRRSLTRPFRLR